MAVHRVATVGVGGFTHRSPGRQAITIGGQRRVTGVAAPEPLNIGGANRVARVSRGGSGSTGGGGRPSGKTRGR